MILLNFEMDYPRQAVFSIFGGKRNDKIRKVIDGKEIITKRMKRKGKCGNELEILCELKET
jgi:hypothetical protein